nr:flagellar basal-body MS-ring/collar protein FliF [Asticcacaulis benevestitus]
MDSFFAGLQKFGVGRLTAILGAAAGAAAVMAAIILNISAQPQSLLYSNLDLKEAAQVTQALDQAGVKYEVKGDGSTIMVDRDKVASTRLLVSGKGLVTSGSVGYELFDTAPVLGQTESVQNLNNKRALEGELARTISSLKGISSTRVHLVMPDRALFSDTAQSPTASVVVGLSGSDLGPDQIRAIRNLVASAVPNLKPDNVTLVDDRNHLLAAGGEGEDSLNGMGSARKSEVEDTLRKRITDIVEGVVGQGAARVTVTADLDQTSTTKEQVEYNPDGQVVRSSRTDEGNEQTSDPNSAGATTASANIPNGTQQAPSLSTAGNSSKTNSEVTNYEISTTKTTSVTTPGEVKKLAVAVVVDGVLTPSKDGKAPPAYAPRSAEDMQKIEELVRAAVGITDTRGDQIKVTNIRFNHGALDVAGTEAKASMFDFDKNDIMRAAEVGVLLLVALLVIFLVARPLVKFINGTPNYLVAANGGMVAGPGGMALAGAGGTPGVAGPDGNFPQIAGGSGGGMVPSVTETSGIDIARIEGQVKASSVKKVSEFVDRHPEESVSILRSWLHDS